MPLTVTVSGNRAYITGDGFAFTAAADGSRVDLTGVGRTVTATFADPQADIQWAGGLISSSSYVFSYRSAAQMHMPGESGHSMKADTNLTGIYISTNSPAWSGISFTSSYLFMCRTDGLVRRRNLVTHAFETLTISASVASCRMIARSDSTVYVYGIEDDDSFVIYKLDFSTSEITQIASEDARDSHRTYACARVRNGAQDVMVCTGTMAFTGNKTALFVMLYDLVSDTVITAQAKLPNSSHMEFSLINGPQIIAQSGDIISFNAAETFDTTINGDTYCLAPLVRVGIDSGVITIVELPVYSYDEDNSETETWDENEPESATDITNGRLYYLTAYDLQDPYIEKAYVRHANPSSYVPALSHDFGDIIGYGGPHLYYGDGGTVLLRHIDVSNDLLKLSLPDGTLFRTLDASQAANWGAIDDENEMYWTVDPDNSKLVGESLGAGPDRDIVIDDWGDTSPPAGLFGRKLFMFNGYAVVSGCTDEVTGGTEYFWFLYPS